MRLFRVFIPVGALTLLTVEILLVTACYLLAAFLFFSPDPTVFLLYEGGFGRIALMVATVILVMYLQDLYSQTRVRGTVLLAQNLCLVMGTAFLVQGSVSYLRPGMRMPIRVMVPAAILSAAAIFGWRLLFTAIVWKVGRQRLLFVGDSRLLDETAAYLARHPDLGMEILGYVDDRPFSQPPAHAKLIGPLAALSEIAAATRPDRIVVGMQERRKAMPMSTLLELRFAGYAVEEAPAFFENICGHVSLEYLRPSQLIFSGQFTSHNHWILGAIDVGLALAGTLLLLPAMLLVAVLIKLSSSGPVLYRQTRVGQDGVPFTLYKFRSMYEDAEKHTGAVWSTANDPRIMPLGRLLRKLRLDEIPQLFNVLRREMSLVGPRPERPEFVQVLSEQIPYYRQRHAVKPGITGWAQINYKYGANFEDAVRKLEYDLYYIKYMSQSLNNYILFATLKTMLLRRGAQ